MKFYTNSLLTSLTFFFMLFSSVLYARVNMTDEVWHFQAFLDDDPIGYHYFELKREDDEVSVFTTAKFDVDFLFINVYSYEHNNSEKWNGTCLKELTSSTNDNGDNLFVNLRVEKEGVRIETATDTVLNYSCVRSFAYWNPDLIKVNKLLNSQTGELVDVELIEVGHEMLTVNNKDVPSKHYRLRGKDLEIDLWYSLEKEWLGLRSKLENGSYLRYVLIDRMSE